MNVAFFVTCLTDTFFPRAGIAAVKVLEHLGHTVHFPQAQTCCGQPMWNNGFHDDARDLAKRMIRVFEPYDTVVSPSGSCVAMIHDYYPEIFRGDHAYEHAAHDLAHKTHEFAAFLFNYLKLDPAKLGVNWQGRVTYHYSCHLRGIGIKSPASSSNQFSAQQNAYSSVSSDQHRATSTSQDVVSRVLGQLPGVEYVPLEKADQCCGFGGTFAVKYPQMSAAMVKDKVACIRASGAPTVVSNEGGCTMNIAGMCHRDRMDVKFISLAEVLAEGLGLLPKHE